MLTINNWEMKDGTRSSILLEICICISRLIEPLPFDATKLSIIFMISTRICIDTNPTKKQKHMRVVGCGCACVVCDASSSVVVEDDESDPSRVIMFWLVDDTVAKSLIWTWEVVRMALCFKLCHELLTLAEWEVHCCTLAFGRTRGWACTTWWRTIWRDSGGYPGRYRWTWRVVSWIQESCVSLSAANKCVVCRPAIDDWSRPTVEIHDQRTGHDWSRPFSWRGGCPDPKDRETQAASRCLESSERCAAGSHLGSMWRPCPCQDELICIDRNSRWWRRWGLPGSPPCGTISRRNCVEGTLGPHLMESHDDTVVCDWVQRRSWLEWVTWARPSTSSTNIRRPTSDLVGEKTFVFPCLSRQPMHILMTRVRVECNWCVESWWGTRNGWQLVYLWVTRCACLWSRVHRIPMQEKCTVVNINSRHGDHEKEELLTFMAHLWASSHRALENRTAIWIMFSSAPQSCELLSFHAHAQLLMSVITCKNASTKSRRLLAYMLRELLILLAFIVDSLSFLWKFICIHMWGFTFERFNSYHVNSRRMRVQKWLRALTGKPVRRPGDPIDTKSRNVGRRQLGFGTSLDLQEEHHHRY